MVIRFRQVVATALFAAGMAGSAAAEIPQVQHIVIIFQENRTPDNLFHGLRQYLPTADIADVGVNSKGKKIPLTPGPLATKYDLNHYHIAFTQMYDNGKMDGADLVHCGPRMGTMKCPANPQFGYVKAADAAPYMFMATHYGFANRMFQGNQGPSFPAHQYILGATSQTTPTSKYFVAENPSNGSSTEGCTAPPAQRVMLIGPDGKENTTARPCFERQTLTDLLDRPPGGRSALSWRYYVPKYAYIWTAPATIRHLCKPAGNPLKCTGTDYKKGDIVVNPALVLQDIAEKKLASVSWVIPSGLESDHPGENDGTGPSWVASVVNAIGESPYWNNTVILVTWDDWGGWYDHVKPPLGVNSYYEIGFRVPLLVISPYTPEGYVSNVTHTVGSVLRFVETAYGLPLIPPGTFLDSRSDDLSDFFNFKAKPRPFIPIPAPIPYSFFANDKRPLTDPDDDGGDKFNDQPSPGPLLVK